MRRIVDAHAVVVLLAVLLGALGPHAAGAQPTPLSTLPPELPVHVQTRLAAEPMALPENAPRPEDLRVPVMHDGRAFHPQRFWWGVTGALAADAGLIYALHRYWYSKYDRRAWHWYDQPGGRAWYDDWFTYVQQDKLGHIFTTFQMARLVGAYGQWSGLSRRRAALFGGLTSLVVESQIELFDGFSVKYGASRTDLLANLLGSTLGGLHVACPQLRALTLKYSYRRSPHYDTSIPLTANLTQDYSGITYWLVLRPERLLPERAAAWWPEALAFAVGHGGEGLSHPVSGVDGSVHRRRLFLAPDLDLPALVDLPSYLRPLEILLSAIRVPAPALQLTPEVRWYWVFY